MGDIECMAYLSAMKEELRVQLRHARADAREHRILSIRIEALQHAMEHLSRAARGQGQVER